MNRKEFIKSLLVNVWLILIFGILSFLIFNFPDKSIQRWFPNSNLVKSFIMALCWVFLFIPVKKEIEKLVDKFMSIIFE